jgi:hypothetical protein
MGLRDQRLVDIAKNYQPVLNNHTGRYNIDRSVSLGSGSRPMGPSNKPALRWAELGKTEEGRKKLREYQLKSAASRRKSIRYKALGYPPKLWKVIEANAAAKAKRLVDILERRDIFEGNSPTDQEYAKQALEILYQIMLLPGAKENRLKAAKTILEYTTPRPTRKIENTTSAEDVLNLLEDMAEAPECTITQKATEDYLMQIEVI